MDKQLELFFATLPQHLHGDFIETTNVMLHKEGKRLNEEVKKLKGSQKTVKLLNVLDTSQVYSLINALAEIGRQYTVIKQDGDSLFNAVLSCVSVPEKFMCDMFRKQIVVFAMRNIEHLESDLVESSQSIESYLQNIAGVFSLGIVDVSF